MGARVSASGTDCPSVRHPHKTLSGQAFRGVGEGRVTARILPLTVQITLRGPSATEVRRVAHATGLTYDAIVTQMVETAHRRVQPGVTDNVSLAAIEAYVDDVRRRAAAMDAFAPQADGHLAAALEQVLYDLRRRAVPT